jgi:asparagine synthase (glutamine-hydrolysing)
MPGLVGFIGDTSPEESRTLIESMAAALHPEPRFRRDLYATQGIGLGRVSLGLVNSAPQPIWNEDQSICIVMEGEIFGYQDLKKLLIERGHIFHYDNDPEFVLHLYEEFGEDTAIKLNGIFIAALYYKRENKLVIINNRLGLYPLYHSRTNGKFRFASGVRSLLADPYQPKKVDPITIIQFLTFDHALGSRTLLEDVYLLPPASILIYKDNDINIRSYWLLGFPEYYNSRSEQYYIDGFLHYLRQAVKRQIEVNQPAGILLSGGLDSRMILALIYENYSDQDFYSFTFGITGCDDARYAQEVASVLKTQHHFFKINSDYLVDVAEEGIRLTDGLENCIHMHSLASLTQETELAKFLFKGFLGDALTGHLVRRILLSNYDENSLNQLFFNHYYITFNQPQLHEILSEKLQKCFYGEFNNDYRETLINSRITNAADYFSLFDLFHRQRRMTLQGVELVRSQSVVRMPYGDNELIDFMLEVPPGLRYEREIMNKAIIQSFPELAKIPYTGTGLPLAECARDLIIRLDRQVRWKLRSLGFNWITVQKKRPYTDYNLWMRTSLRHWLEDILLKKTTLERGYFKPQAIRNLVSEHMNGTNHAPRLGALISLELWHRMFID